MATLIPREFVKDAAEANRVKWRTFDPWSHLLTLVIVQLSRQESLNGICDVAKALAYEWDRAGLELPHRNTLSNANARRNPKMAEDVFWRLLAHLKATDSKFCSGQYGGYLSRIRSHGIFLLDSSTIQLTLNCFDWARHRRMKAAAKLHMTMELSSRLPSFAIVEDAAYHDSTRAAACTAQLGNGDILVADRAYLDFRFFDDLSARHCGTHGVRALPAKRAKCARHCGRVEQSLPRILLQSDPGFEDRDSPGAHALALRAFA